MAEIKKTLIYFEGDDDKAFLEQLKKASLFPNGWELAVRSREHHPGKDGLIRQLLPWVSPINGVGKHAIVLIDLDEMTADGRADWFRRQLITELATFASAVQVVDGPKDGRVRSWRLSGEDASGLVVLICVGCPDNEVLTKNFGIDRFAIDDWVLQLALDQTGYEAVSELKTVPFQTAMLKFTEVADLFRKNALEVRKSKTYIQILRALAAMAPSTATIVGRIVQKGIESLGRESFSAFLKIALDNLSAAATLIASDSTPPKN